MHRFILMCIVLGIPGAANRAQVIPQVRRLAAELSQPKTTDRALREIPDLVKNDAAGRQYVVQRLCELIRKRNTDEVWLNAVRLAGQLRASETIPLLQEALSRGPVGGPMNTTFTTQMRLDDDLVAKALSQIGDPAIPVAMNLLGSPDKKARRRAVLILGNTDTPAARKVLQDRLSHETDARIRELIESGLRSHGSE